MIDGWLVILGWFVWIMLVHNHITHLQHGQLVAVSKFRYALVLIYPAWVGVIYAVFLPQSFL